MIWAVINHTQPFVQVKLAHTHTIPTITISIITQSGTRLRVS
jgi:hypothetical protein